MEGIYYELNPYTMCRTCLGQHLGMLDLLITTDRQKHLQDMLKVMLDFEVQCSGNIPFYVCELCESKIEAGFYFREQCRKNNSLMQQYICTQLMPFKSEDSFNEEESKISVTDNVDSNPTVNHTYFTTEENLSNQNRGLQQFPYKEVSHVEDSFNEEESKISVTDNVDSNPTVNHTYFTTEENVSILKRRLQQFPYEVVSRMEDSFNKKESKISVTDNVDSNPTVNHTYFTTEENLSNQNRRLQQFPYEEVSRVVEEIKKQFYDNAECVKCGFIASNSNALHCHMTYAHKESINVWCGKCNKVCEDLPEHNKIHESEQLKCQFCNKSYKQKRSLYEHLWKHAEVENVKCDICKKTFNSMEELKLHLSVHVVEDKNDGSTKDAELVNNCNANNKKVEHSNTEKTKEINNAKLCTECGKQFRTTNKLTIHMRIHTGEMPYKCSYCDKRAITRNSLVIHERIHTGEKPHICQYCGKRFAQTSVLRTHLRLHTGRTETCIICEKTFCRPSELKLHMRKHTGEKPFKCKICNECFIQRSHLASHEKSHSEKRSYTCTHCSKSFKHSSTLKSHIKIHLGCKPYKCTKCPYSCRQSYALAQHMKQHLEDTPRPDRPYKCQNCNRTFTTIAVMTSHMRSVHNIN